MYNMYTNTLHIRIWQICYCTQQINGISNQNVLLVESFYGKNQSNYRVFSDYDAVTQMPSLDICSFYFVSDGQD